MTQFEKIRFTESQFQTLTEFIEWVKENQPAALEKGECYLSDKCPKLIAIGKLQDPLFSNLRNMLPTTQNQHPSDLIEFSFFQASVEGGYLAFSDFGIEYLKSVNLI